jgi:hypothetical protein
MKIFFRVLSDSGTIIPYARAGSDARIPKKTRRLQPEPEKQTQSGADMFYLDPSLCRYDGRKGDIYILCPWSGDAVRIRAWSDGCAQECLTAGQWRYSPESLDMPFLDPDLTGGESGHPLALYAKDLPEDIVSAIRRYDDGQQSMLQLCASSERAVQLLRDSPNFLWLVAPFLTAAGGGRREQIHAMLGWPRRLLLEKASGMTSFGCNPFRLLQKLPAPALGECDRSRFFAALADERSSFVLKHKEKCAWWVIRFVVEYLPKKSRGILAGLHLFPRG